MLIEAIWEKNKKIMGFYNAVNIVPFLLIVYSLIFNPDAKTW